MTLFIATSHHSSFSSVDHHLLSEEKKQPIHSFRA